MWKPVRDYEGLYEINVLGEIRSLKRKGSSGGLLKQQTDKYGYPSVSLCKEGKQKTWNVHRLMAKTFLDFDETMQVNHINENKTDNRLENLELISQTSNLNFGTRNKRISNAFKNITKETGVFGGIKPKKVLAYRYETMEFVGLFESIKEAEKVLGVDHSHISKCCKGKLKQTKGYTFSYSD